MLMRIALKNGCEIEEKGSRKTIEKHATFNDGNDQFWDRNGEKIGSKREPKSIKKQ